MYFLRLGTRVTHVSGPNSKQQKTSRMPHTDSMRSTLGWFHHHMWMISSVIPCLPKSKWNNITCVECSRLALELLDVPGFGRLVHFLSIPGLQHSFTSELKKKAARKSRGRRRRIHHYFSHQRNSQRAVAPHLPSEQIPSASPWLTALLILLKG